MSIMNIKYESCPLQWKFALGWEVLGLKFKIGKVPGFWIFAKFHQLSYISSSHLGLMHFFELLKCVVTH
jgi:hypothetical protein